MGVNFTPIVDIETLSFTMGVKFTPIVDVEILSFTMGMIFTPIVDNSAHEEMSKSMEIPS